MLPILLAALESSDDKALFRQFFARHDGTLRRYAQALLHTPALAEEAMQDAWLRCVQHADTFCSLPADKRLPWMVVVVKHAAFDLMKKEARHCQLDPSWDAPAPEAGDPGGIVDVIRALPPQYRTILELKFLLEWSDKDIARHLHLPVSTVSSRIQRGRKLLQTRLLEEGYVP